ncbi:MAG: 2Fe-2S iron-sulfur cluster binding domain-containing protein, partial [Acidimicrobiales bacterium]
APDTGSIAFARSGVTADVTGTSILDTAESVGLTPESGCRMGICHTCTRAKESGCVRNVLTGELSSDGPEDIQICISAPVGDVVVDL